MKRMAIGVLITGSLAASRPAGLMAQTAKSDLRQQLETAYVPVKLRKHQVTQPGTVLIVEKEGIGAIPAPPIALGTTYFGNNLKDGRIRHDRTSELIQGNTAGLRELQVGERVYLTKVEVKDGGVTLVVESCGACDPAVVEPNPYLSGITFPFPKGYTETFSIDRIREAIAPVLSFAGGSAGAPAAPQPPPPVTDAAPPAAASPPDMPPPAPVKIELGQTVEQVTAAMGQPEKMVDLGSKKIYLYKDLKITFVDGKVSDVE